MTIPDIDCHDSELVVRLQQSSKKAFEAIYERYWAKLYAYVNRNLHSREDTEEILHEVMLTLWKNRNSLTISHLDIYLFVSARNQINKYIRREISFRKYWEFQIMSRLEDHDTFGESDTEQEFKARLDRILERMPAKTAMIFKMSKFNELPVKEIANQLDLSEKAIEYHITKSMKLIRKSFDSTSSKDKTA